MSDIKKSVQMFELIKVFATKAPWVSVRPPDEYISTAITAAKEMPLHFISIHLKVSEVSVKW